MGEILNHINLMQLMIFKYTYKKHKSQENNKDIYDCLTVILSRWDYEGKIFVQ
jgi:hypothetical protein